MVRASSSNTTTATSNSVVSKTPAPVPISAPVEEPKVNAKKSSKKSKKEAVVAEQPAPVVEVPPVKTVESEPVVDETTSVVAPVQSAETTVSLKMNEFHAQLSQLTVLVQNIKNQYRTLEKSFNKELKAYYKASSKRNKRSGNRQPSGFVRPTLISEELANFLGKEVGTEMARTEVSKEINQYIRSNNLQDKTNGRNIIPDAKLTALLKLKEGDLLSYFNLQKYMKHHFVKAPVQATA